MPYLSKPNRNGLGLWLGFGVGLGLELVFVKSTKMLLTLLGNISWEVNFVSATMFPRVGKQEVFQETFQETWKFSNVFATTFPGLPWALSLEFRFVQISNKISVSRELGRITDLCAIVKGILR